jgi:hypothetical protein
MYKSPILKKAILILYTTEPWRTAISQPWLVDVEDYDGAFRAFPPVGFVAFAACAVSETAFLSCTTDSHDF